MATTAKKPGDPGYDPAVDGADTSSALTSGTNTSSLFSSIPTGGNIDPSVSNEISSEISGAAYQPYETQAQEALARSAANIRANTGAQNAPNLGQGSANAAQEGAENNIMQNLSTNEVSMAQGEEATKQAGVNAYNQTASTAISEQQTQNSEEQQAYTNAINAGDFTTAASIYNQMNPGQTLDATQLRTQQAAQNTLTQQQVSTGTLNLTAQQQTGVQSMINSGATLDQINQAYPGVNMSQTQYDSMAAMYKSTLGTSNVNLEGLQQKLGSDKYNAIQNMVNTGATVDQINAQYGAGTISQDQYNSMESVSQTTLAFQTLKQNATLAQAGIVSAQTIAGMNISSNQTIAQMQINSAQTLAANANALTQQGIDLNKASIEGFTDPTTGQYVMGSAAIAAQSLGLQATTVQEGENQLYGTTINGQWVNGTMQNMSAAQKQQADSLYGYTDANGNHVAGSLELQQDQVTIQKEGLTLEQAQTQGYIDSNGNFIMGSTQIAAQNAQGQNASLFGYTDPTTGQHVAGSIDLANKTFGLNATSVQAQVAAVMGYQDPTTGQWVNGSIANASATQQNQAYGLYGYALDANGNKVSVGSPDAIAGTAVSGSMQLQADSVAIQQQGLTLQSAQLEGYTDSNGNHVDGSLEVAQSTLNLSSASYQDQHNQLFGYYDSTTGKYVNGTIANMDETQQNQAYSLYGYALDAQGNKIQIGDPSAVPGSSVQGSLSIQYQNSVTSQEATRASINSTNQATASATYWDTSKEVETYAQTHLDASKDFNTTMQDPDFVALMSKWYTQQTGQTADTTSAAFKTFAQNEISAAQDNRLTNPIDQAVYEINSSTTLSDQDKANYVKIFEDAPQGATFSVDNSGNLVENYTPAPGTDTSGFKAQFTLDTTNTSVEGSFLFAANGEFNNNGTYQQLAPDQTLTIKGNARTQGIPNLIPAGNYVVLSSTTIQSATPDANGNYTIFDTTGKNKPTTTKTPAPGTSASGATTSSNAPTIVANTGSSVMSVLNTGSEVTGTNRDPRSF